jgi:hypothetical protein
MNNDEIASMVKGLASVTNIGQAENNSDTVLQEAMGELITCTVIGERHDGTFCVMSTQQRMPDIAWDLQQALQSILND